MNRFLVKLTGRLKDRAGAAIALVALSMVALLSAVALAVDVGMLVTARTEAQTLADGAALEGARVLMKSQGDSAAAHAAAMDAGSTDNTVRGVNVPVLEEDVDVLPDEWTVRVRVRRTTARGNAVPTYFARVFGVNEVDIVTNAAAWAIESSTVGNEDDASCPALPLALLDKFVESNGEPGWQPPEEVVGWTADDHGTLVRLKQKPNAGFEPLPVTNEIDYCEDSTQGSSWRCWWRDENEDPNSPNVAAKIRGEDCTDPLSDSDSIYNASGNMQSNVHDDFKWLIEQEPDLEWCDDCGGDNGCVVEAPSNECFTGESLRLRTIPIVDQYTLCPTCSGSEIHGEVTGFMGVFVERVAETYAGNEQVNGKMNVYLRFITIGGQATGGEEEGEHDPEALVRTLQLIE